MFDWHSLLGNQFVSGGFALMAGGAMIATLRKVPESIWRWAKNRVFYTIEIDSTDSSFTWLRAYLGSIAKCRYMGAGIAPKAADGPIYPNSSQSPTFHTFPLGSCVFRHNGKRVMAWVAKDPVTGTTGFRETIVIRCLGDGRRTMKSLLSAAHKMVTEQDGPTVEVWVPDGTFWRLAERKPVRPASSLCLPDGVEDAIIADARRFVADRQWYRSVGVPHRRGYLLHGPPGNGKSSLAHALASELGRNVSVVNLGSFRGDDTMLACLGNAPRGNVLVLEDIDAAYSGRKAQEGGPTFSGLLNALDGLVAQDGRIVVMTTNHIDRLDPALIRPGRADVHLFIANASHAQAVAMFLRFFPGQVRENAELFAGGVGNISMAKLQEYLLQHRDDARAAIRDVRDLALLPICQTAESQAA